VTAFAPFPDQLQLETTFPGDFPESLEEFVSVHGISIGQNCPEFNKRFMTGSLSDRDHVIFFSSSPQNLLFSGIYLSCRFWLISGYLLACFPGLATRDRTEGSNPHLSAIQSCLCSASLRDSAITQEFSWLHGIRGRFPPNKPNYFPENSPKFRFITNADFAGSGSLLICI